MKQYFSSNGWIGWAAILIDPCFYNKGRFLMAGFKQECQILRITKSLRHRRESQRFNPYFRPANCRF